MGLSLVEQLKGITTQDQFNTFMNTNRTSATKGALNFGRASKPGMYSAYTKANPGFEANYSKALGLEYGGKGLASSLTAKAPGYNGVGVTGSSLSADLQDSLSGAVVKAQAQTNFAADPTVGNADLLKDSTASFTPTISGDYKGHPFGDSITLENGKAMNDGGLFGAERAATATDFNNYNDSVAAGVVDPAKMDQKTWAKLKNDSDANSSANWSTGVTAALGIGQLGLGVASYLDQKDMLKANKKLLNQQYNINDDKFTKSKQYDIDRKAAWTVK